MTEFTNSIILRWKKDLDDKIFGEIKQKMLENGLETEYVLNEKAFMSAIKKQIPKEPLVCGFREGREINTISYTCPICHKHISRDSFCKHCGQALDWSDTE